MLTLATRHTFKTLLNAITLTAENKDKPAIIYVETGKADTVISRADFRQSIEQYASAFHEMGIQPRDLIILAHTQNLESIYGFWGALLLGAIPSMFPTLTKKLDRDIYMQHMAQLVERSQVRAILTTDNFAPELTKQVNCPVFGSSALSAVSHVPSPPTDPKPEHVAFLQHSSGTTGLQKGVALSHQAVLNQIASYSDTLNLSSDDVIVSWLPLYHDMGLIAGFLLPLIQGIPLVLMSPFDWVARPALLFRAINQHNGTLCWLPNFAYNHCARRIRKRDLEGLSLESMRMFINCSEPVHHASHQLFMDKYQHMGITPAKLAVSYAMAENTFAVTQTQPDEPATLDIIDQITLEQKLKAVPVSPNNDKAMTKVSCGQPIPGTTIRVVGNKGQTLPERHVGEILVKSNCMLTGYYHRDDLAPFDESGWYQTGDRGYIADGEVYIIGRSKDLIINAGKNIYPQDIEAIVNTVEGIHPGRAVVFGVPDEREGTELIAVVAETHQTDELARKHIWQTIKQTVASQTQVTISYVHLVEAGWLIKTSSGKISRSANREKWRHEMQSNHS